MGGGGAGEGWAPSNDDSCDPGWMLPLILFSLAYSSFIITGVAGLPGLAGPGPDLLSFSWECCWALFSFGVLSPWLA